MAHTWSLERALGRLSSASFSPALSLWRSTDTPITARSLSAATLPQLPPQQMSGKWEKEEQKNQCGFHFMLFQTNIKTSSWVGRLAACLQIAFSSTWPQSSRETEKTHKDSLPQGRRWQAMLFIFIVIIRRVASWEAVTWKPRKWGKEHCGLVLIQA